MRAWSVYALEALWLTAAWAVPLAFNPWGHNAFELPKAVLLRALVLLMGLAALVGTGAGWEAPERGAARRRVAPWLGPALALGLAYALATALSVNPRVSLWGSDTRQQGLLTQGAYLALFLLTAAHLRTRAQAVRLWRTLVWGSVPVVVYGLLQGAGLDPLDWRTDAVSPVLSTFGRANLFGSYLVLIIPLTARQCFCAVRRWPHALLLAGQLSCLALTQARGAWLGLGAAMLMGLVVWAAATRDRRPLSLALALAALTVAFAGALNVPDGPLASLTPLPGLDRLVTLGRADAGSPAARLTVWRATLPLIAARPWLGYGPETLRTVFAPVFPPQLVYYQGRHVTVDRAHNLWLDLGMSVGLTGILAFAALLGVLGWRAWRGLRAVDDRGTRLTWTALAAAIVGHLVDLQFSFDLTAGATVFWLLLAMIAALGWNLAFAREPLARTKSPRRLWATLHPALPPALLVCVLIGLVCLRPLLADVAYWQAQDGRTLDERWAAATRAVRLWPLAPTYRLGLAATLGEGGDRAAAETQLEAATRLNPDDPGLWAARGALYARWGDARAVWAYRQAIDLAPNVAAYHTALGLILARQGRPAEGVSALERAVALDATDGVAYAYLADLYEALGYLAQARQARQAAERWGARE